MNNFDLKSFVRPNIWTLKPYSSARDEFWGEDGIFLDANENPFGTKNRYPDPHQRKLKKTLSERKNISESNIFIGNGSDEIIDLIIRIFCEPQKDSILICPPTYGMYEVSANINNVNITRVPLNDHFELNHQEILSKDAKCIFICSPNNPTANLLKDVDRIIKDFQGIVIVDEAYIDFSDSESYINRLEDFPNLIVMQTFSKAWGLAAVRVGVAYASEKIINLMDKIKPPYNVSKLNQEEAIEALSKSHKFEDRLSVILEQRELLKKDLSELSYVQNIYPSDSNFLLVKMNDANKVYNYLVSKNIIIRNRHSEISNCIRISVGSPEENRQLIAELRNYKED